MNESKRFAMLACVLVAGCASAPEQTVQNPAPAVEAAAEVETAGGGTPIGAEIPAGIDPDATLAAADAQLNGVDVPLSETDPDDGSVMTCRQMLQPGSNTVVRRCASRDDWETYDRAVELWSRQMLRLWQGSAFRF